MYRALVALGNILYAARQFNTPLPAEDVARARSTLEGIEKLSLPPRSGQSAVDLAAEQRKIANVAKEILGAL